ncbi:hypothetical protein [Paractinoplanes toevensis]|uniref:Uncharacterized protein n=1 Tax=Paractinoplanes toevensis TaxID=571911 RepID=A0A919THD9_9ACTN|nr:hypothetical protein [Actinoplanes toevensis]GIM95377.1 hypothetical protein Ato02nite_071700 [Actinoplanes toevensis]
MPAVLRHRMVALIVTLAVAAVAVALLFAAGNDTFAGTNWDNVVASTTWDD